jgi:acetyl esterase/lipase
MPRFASSYFSTFIAIIAMTFIILATGHFIASAQTKPNTTLPKPDSAQTKYYAEIKTFSDPFVHALQRNYVQTYSLPEKEFVRKTDSARALLLGVLNKYSPKLEPALIKEQQLQINYYIDKLLADYPANYAGYTGHAMAEITIIPARLQKHLTDLNDAALVNNVMFRSYVHAYFAFALIGEVKKPRYNNADNRSLLAMINIINRLVANKKCRDFWQYDYLYNYIINNGIKGTGKTYRAFKTTCADTAYLHRVNDLYAYEYKFRQGHLLVNYKTVGPFRLEMHLFLPDSAMKGPKHPVMVYFHPGDWREGKPDWYFDNCMQYAHKGWAACSIEYRTYDREGATPFDAVKDARSAIRWLRGHAAEFNIDTSRIVANGYDAGGQLALACAMVSQYNENTDDLHFSPVPNSIMVTSGIYDLTDNSNAWLRRDMRDKSLLREISPLYRVKPGMPPVLIIHGRKDDDADYATAHHFEQEMHQASNTVFFHPVDGAGHLLWLDTKFAGDVEKVQQDFLRKYGYDR